MNIAIVNDVSMICAILKKIIHENSTHQVIWTAENGAVALEKAQSTPPDMILMDLIMPVMNGVEATREIMKSAPCAILVVTASVNQNADMVFSAMAHGALDAISTPTLSPGAGEEGIAALLHKLSIIERLIVSSASSIDQNKASVAKTRQKKSEFPLVCIGASTGGPGALGIVLSKLPSNLQASVVIVQHVDADFTAGLAEWLNSQCKMEVSVAKEDGEIEINQVYIAGGDEHLSIDRQHNFHFNAEPKELFYRPSIDVFFHSIEKHWSDKIIGALLTGMGDDGADGLLALKKNNKAFTIAQDEETSAVYGMPRAAVKLNAAEVVLPIEEIADSILGKIKNA